MLKNMNIHFKDLPCIPNIYVSWSTSEIRVRLVPSSMFKPSSHLLTDRSKAVLLLWILFVICVSCLSLSHCLVCPLQPCGQGKGWPLVSLVCNIFLVFLSLSNMMSWIRSQRGGGGALIFSSYHHIGSGPTSTVHPLPLPPSKKIKQPKKYF